MLQLTGHCTLYTLSNARSCWDRFKLLFCTFPDLDGFHFNYIPALTKLQDAHFLFTFISFHCFEIETPETTSMHPFTHPTLPALLALSSAVLLSQIMT